MARVKRVKPFTFFVLALLSIGGLYLAVDHFWGIDKLANSLVPETKQTNTNSSASDIKVTQTSSGSSGCTDDNTIKVGIVDWVGYAGGIWYNGGYEASTDSAFFKNFGTCVHFIVDNDGGARDMFNAGAVDLVWATLDSAPTEMEAIYANTGAKVIFQADWSRGGDAMVVTPGINSLNQLKGKKVAVALNTPSHTFLLHALKSAGLSMRDIEVVSVGSALDAASVFQSRRIDAAVVWSPDDQVCVEKINGSKVIISTKTASHIIADVFYVRGDVLRNSEKRQHVYNVVKGWMLGAAEINSNPSAMAEVPGILAKKDPSMLGFFQGTVNNAYRTTLGDNAQFFGLTEGAVITGSDLYTQMSDLYRSIGAAKNPPSWRTIADPSFINKLMEDPDMQGEKHSPEQKATFTKVAPEKVTEKAISAKPVSIYFLSGSAVLDPNATNLVEVEMVPTIRGFANARIILEGHTDSDGDAEMNKSLSQRRAQSVADYLVKVHGFDPNRFTVIDYGEDQPVASNSTSDGKAQNRRTTLRIVGE